MPIKLPPQGRPDRIEWDDGSGLQWVLHSDFQGNPGSGQHPERMREAVQNRIDARILLSDLPIDDPERLIDPDSGDRMFWGTADGKKVALEPFESTLLVSRTLTLTILEWVDGEGYHCECRGT